MDIGTILTTMRDPAGIPSHPLFFQVLMVLTWTFHIAFVHLTLGSAGLAVFAFHRRHRNTNWEQLSIALTKVAKVGVSLLIVLGVAPLLFTQVIYDPQWYASNVLSGAWAIVFIFTLIAAYCCWFSFYYANHSRAKKHIGIYAWFALFLFCLDGTIMHALSYQAILPERWMEWYAPNGLVDTSGASLHAIQWSRFAFIMSLSIPVTGLFLIAYCQYFSVRPDRHPEYLTFARTLGRKLAYRGFTLSLLLLLMWQVHHPEKSGLISHPVGWLLVSGIASMTLWSTRLHDRIHGYAPLAVGFSLLLILSLWREIIRIRYLKPFNYDVTNYTVHTDWPSTLLFFSTVIGVGGLVGGFYLTVLYLAGRTQGIYTASRTVSRLGNGAIAVLTLWIATFFIYGIAIWVNNNFFV